MATGVSLDRFSGQNETSCCLRAKPYKDCSKMVPYAHVSALLRRAHPHHPASPHLEFPASSALTLEPFFWTPGGPVQTVLRGEVASCVACVQSVIEAGTVQHRQARSRQTDTPSVGQAERVANGERYGACVEVLDFRRCHRLDDGVVGGSYAAGCPNKRTECTRRRQIQPRSP